MSAPDHSRDRGYESVQKLRDWFSRSLGISARRRDEVYLEVSHAATLRDASYWFQIFFAAGIATLGLILDSPAVIIGAMLISPLMGPILSSGLALAAGDLVLGIRATLNLLLSCMTAVGFAVLLVWALPFKEVTSEISSRVQPTTLDLLVALFSGAIGAISTCKRAKGMVTSIPGVAIAVALMPPLCVVGFGIGLAASVSISQGLQIAGGGALLFLTNLVAITFTAMFVFLALQIGTRDVRSRVADLLEQDIENLWVRSLLRRTPILGKLKWFQSLSARVVSTTAVLTLLAIPLAQSFTHLKNEITRKQQEDELLSTATRLCQEKMSGKLEGPRCYVGHVALAIDSDRAVVNLRVFTRKPYSELEKTKFLNQAAAILRRSPESISLQLVEIPTAASDLIAAETTPKKPTEPVLTAVQLQNGLVRAVDSSLQSLQLPAPAQMIDYKLAAGSKAPFEVTIAYLSDHLISTDAQNLLSSEVRQRLGDDQAAVEFQSVLSTPISIDFRADEATLSKKNAALLERAGQTLKDHPLLSLSVQVDQAKYEKPERAVERRQYILDYFKTNWTVDPGRIHFSSSENPQRRMRTVLELRMVLGHQVTTRS
jgi:uncharacterized hydrophobic protein (TIGR00271 family)